MGKAEIELRFLGLSCICSSLGSVQGEGLTAAQYVVEEAKLSVGNGEKCAPLGIFSEICSNRSGLKTCTAVCREGRTISYSSLGHRNT